MRNRIKAAYARAVLFIIRPVMDEWQRDKEKRFKVEAAECAARSKALREAIRAAERPIDIFRGSRGGQV